MNIQPIEKRVVSAVKQLDVHSIFYTIQGEGPFCGTPCVFVRLAGCNLACPACDTEYTAGRRAMDARQVVDAVRGLHGAPVTTGRRLVVVTGGEPFRQHLGNLFEALCHGGFFVQVETNGTLPPPSSLHADAWHYEREPSRRRGVYVVCSPKTPKLDADVLRVACALKYVVGAGRVAADGLPLSALGMPNPPARPPLGWERPVYVQPLDEQDDELNRHNNRTAVASSMGHGYTLQIQTHKIVGVE